MKWKKATELPTVGDDGKSDFFLLAMEDEVYGWYTVGYYCVRKGWVYYGPRCKVHFYMEIPDAPESSE